MSNLRPIQTRNHAPTNPRTTGPWQEQAMCTQAGPEFFFPSKGESTGEAKYLCGMCPVRAECLEAAMRLEGTSRARQDRHGVWGGLTPTQRAQLGPGWKRALK